MKNYMIKVKISNKSELKNSNNNKNIIYFKCALFLKQKVTLVT